MYYDMFHYPSDATFGYVEYSQVTDILLECVEQHSMKIRELGAQGLWQLSNMPPYNKILAQKYYCRKALTKLLSDKNSNVRANGASALYELSQWKQNKRVLATHFDGLLLDELIRVARDDSNESARYHASNAIKRLISEETVGLVASHVFPHLANGNPRPDEVNRVTALKDYMTEYLKHKRQSMDEEDPINNEPSATIGSLD
uniref:Condensin complex subunit 1 C-terminal domain-containing protein n=1 Tax=Leptocylindrus danicus TaxID=163516 RepID=A0A7S2LAP1_9STRA